MAQSPYFQSVSREVAKYPGLDAKAVLSVASQEGLGGGIGDNGTSFGPFQLHIGGAYPSSAPQAPQAAQQWAWSPAGIDYALQRINQVAGGLKGAQAIDAIVSRFERPANPSAEIAGATRTYGTQPPAAPLPTVGGAPLTQPAYTSPLQNPLVQAVVTHNDALLGIAPPPFPAPVVSNPSQNPAAPPGTTPQRTEASAKAPRISGSTLKFLESFSSPYGLTITATTNGRHVKNSYHYRGRAVDLAGDPTRMAQLAEAALSHPQDFVEMFYTGPGSPGYFIKNGQVYPNSQLDRSVAEGHTNHVHLAA